MEAWGNLVRALTRAGETSAAVDASKIAKIFNLALAEYHALDKPAGGGVRQPSPPRSRQRQEEKEFFEFLADCCFGAMVSPALVFSCTEAGEMSKRIKAIIATSGLATREGKRELLRLVHPEEGPGGDSGDDLFAAQVIVASVFVY